MRPLRCGGAECAWADGDFVISGDLSVPTLDRSTRSCAALSLEQIARGHARNDLALFLEKRRCLFERFPDESFTPSRGDEKSGLFVNANNRIAFCAFYALAECARRANADGNRANETEVTISIVITEISGISVITHQDCTSGACNRLKLLDNLHYRAHGALGRLRMHNISRHCGRSSRSGYD